MTYILIHLSHCSFTSRISVSLIIALNFSVQGAFGITSCSAIIAVFLVSLMRVILRYSPLQAYLGRIGKDEDIPSNSNSERFRAYS